MLRNLKPSLFLFLYSALWRVLGWLLFPLLRKMPRLATFWQERHRHWQNFTRILAEARDKSSPRYLVFCSSAGEYEQAKPIITRLKKERQALVFVILVSPSGLRFARSQGDQEPIAMAASDDIWYWRSCFALLQPDAVLIIRYELWPGFLATAAAFCPVYLVDASAASHLQQTFFARKLRQRLLTFCSSIAVVSEPDLRFHEEILLVPRSRLRILGDSKYDRVIERQGERKPQLARLRQQLADFLQRGGPVLVIGSAWPKDLEAFLSVAPKLFQATPTLSVIIAPHDISPNLVDPMEKAMLEKNLKVCRLTRNGIVAARAEDDILLVDTIGLLPELYALADVAWVGGGMHYRVHNVLEPACLGTWLCFGPLYTTSQEARDLVDKKLAQVIYHGQDFWHWWQTLTWHQKPPHHALVEEIARQRGASDRIMQMLSQGNNIDKIRS